MKIAVHHDAQLIGDSLARPANGAHRAGVSSDRSRTSVCHWPHVRPALLKSII